MREESGIMTLEKERSLCIGGVGPSSLPYGRAERYSLYLTLACPGKWIVAVLVVLALHMVQVFQFVHSALLAKVSA